MKGIIILSIALSCAVSLSAQELLTPNDFQYLGAFRLPEGSGGSDWGYSGEALTYYPIGDPSGSDEHVGSLFGVGHAWHSYISEISIPQPIISPSKNPDDLPVARTLREFTDVRTGIGQLNVLQEIVRVGMEYLPARGSQSEGKLYLSWGAHFQEDEQNVASHMWCNPDFTGAEGAWWVADYSLYSVNDYLFEIPQEWADQYTGGRSLATGRYRDGGWSGMGPSLYAIAPWQHGTPPVNGARLEAVQMMQYSTTFHEDPTDYRMQDYHNSDEWTGGAWLESGNLSAVVFVGTKGIGDSAWYGNSLGPCLECDERGWWSAAFQGQFRFFDPRDLAHAAEGIVQPYEVQPYAVLPIDEVLFSVDSANMKYHTAGCAYDRERNFFYMMEPTADESRDRSIIHVWRIAPESTDADEPEAPTTFALHRNYPNPFRDATNVSYSLPEAVNVTLTVYDELGRTVATLADGEYKAAGTHTARFLARDLPAGVYHCRLSAGEYSAALMMVVAK